MWLPGPESELSKTLAMTVLAAFGGALSYVWRTTKAGKKLYLARALLSSLLVAFICFHLGLVYQEMGLSEHMVWALNGFTAVIGVEGLIFLITKILYKFLKVTENDVIIKELMESGWTPPPGSNIPRVGNNESGKR